MPMATGNLPPDPADHCPYHLMSAFAEGATAFACGTDPYAHGSYESPYNWDSVEDQAYNRGVDHAFRMAMWRTRHRLS
jgi:hypothetical protein